MPVTSMTINNHGDTVAANQIRNFSVNESVVVKFPTGRRKPNPKMVKNRPLKLCLLLRLMSCRFAGAVGYNAWISAK